MLILSPSFLLFLSSFLRLFIYLIIYLFYFAEFPAFSLMNNEVSDIKNYCLRKKLNFPIS